MKIIFNLSVEDGHGIEIINYGFLESALQVFISLESEQICIEVCSVLSNIVVDDEICTQIVSNHQVFQ